MGRSRLGNDGDNHTGNTKKVVVTVLCRNEDLVSKWQCGEEGLVIWLPQCPHYVLPLPPRRWGRITIATIRNIWEYGMDACPMVHIRHPQSSKLERALRPCVCHLRTIHLESLPNRRIICRLVIKLK
eukprot:scaffold2325_cov24-Attheya_sp.AAC.1